MNNSTSPYRPSPLSLNGPRTSPFRRQSQSGSSPTTRPGTPGNSPSRGYTPVQSPSKLHQSYTVEDDDASPTSSPRSNRPIPQPDFTRDRSPSPTKAAESPSNASTTIRSKPNGISTDAAAQLAPAQLREIREAFQVLDRDNDGSVNKDDVADVLQNIGQDSSSSATSQYFGAGSQTINFPTFLNTLSSLLAPISSRQELVNALAAFDEDDSGQIDVAELREALVHTQPEPGQRPLTGREIDEVLGGFTGRRAFGGRTARSGGGKKGEVFRYHELVNGIMGTDNPNSNGQRDAART